MVFYIMGAPLNGVLYNGAPLNGVLYNGAPLNGVPDPAAHLHQLLRAAVPHALLVDEGQRRAEVPNPAVLKAGEGLSSTLYEVVRNVTNVGSSVFDSSSA